MNQTREALRAAIKAEVRKRIREQTGADPDKLVWVGQPGGGMKARGQGHDLEIKKVGGRFKAYFDGQWQGDYPDWHKARQYLTRFWRQSLESVREARPSPDPSWSRQRKKMELNLHLALSHANKALGASSGEEAKRQIGNSFNYASRVRGGLDSASEQAMDRAERVLSRAIAGNGQDINPLIQAWINAVERAQVVQ